jgi:cytidyltransferase-like protein
VTATENIVVVSGDFDDIRSRHVRFLQESARFGNLHVLLRNDDFLRLINKKAPKFPEQERLYYLQAIRFVQKVHLVQGTLDIDVLPNIPDIQPTVWAVAESEHIPKKKAYCQDKSLRYEIITQQQLQGFPDCNTNETSKDIYRKKVLVTGCYDWFHSGHVRFFEECSELGDLYVIVGHDANIKALKGPGHPMFSQQERRYMVQSVRYVRQALISTGNGWLDAEPEIERIKPDIYAVNEDGDKPIKRYYCQEHGIEYVVLKRLPKPGLKPRVSTNLRGF